MPSSHRSIKGDHGRSRPAGSETSLEAFKSRLPLAEIVGRHVRLTKRGREHTGLCPFHQEKSPSFSVVEDKGFYHCFGCGAHGTAIDFIMQIEGLSFPDALERLGDLTGIEPPRRRPEEAARAAPGLAEANAAAMRWFADQLRRPHGREALAYLDRRGVNAASIERFHLGYAPADRHGLKSWLASNGFAESLAIEAGLLIAPEDGGAAYDRFRQRLMFPIDDHRGRIVGFGGRALAEQKAKYLNSPETPLFLKGTLLFGLPLASQAARKAHEILLVEGYMDVVALAQAGIEHVVAPLGTAVTEDQLRLLWRHADEPTVCLDGDKAGFAAALRAARRALPIMQGGQSLKFVILPEGEDPDSLVRQRGRATLDGLIRTAIPLSRLIWQAEWAGDPLSTPERLANLRHRLLDYVKLAAEPTLRGMLRDQFDSLINARRPQRYRGERSPRARATLYETSLTRAQGMLDPDRVRDHRLMGPFLRNPQLLERFGEALGEIALSDSAADGLRQEVLAWHAAADDLDPDALRHHLQAHGFGQLADAVAGNTACRPEDEAATVAKVLEVWRRRRAQELQGDGTGVAIEQRRLDELDAHRLSQDELLNGPPGLMDADEGFKTE